MRGSEDPHIHGDDSGTSHTDDLFLLQDAEQSRLQVQRQIIDLVDEQCAAGGAFDVAVVFAHGAGESSPFVPEQLALQERSRKRGAVQRHEGTVTARTQIMEGTRNQFLSRAAFAADQDRVVPRGDEAYRLRELAHRGGIADDRALLELLDLAAQLLVLVHHPPELVQMLEDAQQPVRAGTA